MTAWVIEIVVLAVYLFLGFYARPRRVRNR